MQQFKKLDVQINTTHTTLLGSTFGQNEEHVTHITKQKVEQITTMFDSLALMPLQEVFQIVRKCLIPKISFLMRTMTPSTFSPASRMFDNKLQEILRKTFADLSVTALSVSHI